MPLDKGRPVNSFHVKDSNRSFLQPALRWSSEVCLIFAALPFAVSMQRRFKKIWLCNLCRKLDLGL